jgi:hypothetical protein
MALVNWLEEVLLLVGAIAVVFLVLLIIEIKR